MQDNNTLEDGLVTAQLMIPPDYGGTRLSTCHEFFIVHSLIRIPSRRLNAVPSAIFSSTLHPPNILTLSDSVIGRVVPRRTTQASGRSGLTIGASHPLEDPQKSSDSASATGAIPTKPRSASTRYSKKSSGKPSGTTEALARYRLYRRDIQRRYRQKERDKELSLEKCIEQLRAEIRNIEWMRRNTVYHEGLVETTAWGMVVEFFRLFKNGYKPPKVSFNPSSDVPGLCHLDNSTQKLFMTGNPFG